MSGYTVSVPTATMSAANGLWGAFPVGLGYYPREGSRAVAVQYNWTSQSAYLEDLSQLEAMGVETTIQSVFIDNSTVGSTVTLVTASTGQMLTIPANSQGVFPLLLTGAPGYSISVPATTSGTTRLWLMNVPSGASVWSPAGSAGTMTYLSSPPELANNAITGWVSDAYGSQGVNTEAAAPVFGTAVFFAAVASATDIFTIYGSATKTVRIHQIFVTTNAGVTCLLVRRSSANSGGTFNALAAGKYDSANAAATATAVGYYTANPASLGTTVGTFDGLQIASTTPFNFQYGVTDQSIVLRGVNDGIGINLNGSGAGQGMSVKIKWSEV